MRKSYAIILCLLICSTSFAVNRNYYISPSGSDLNPGTFAFPWRTADKVNTSFSSFVPGDSILFERGSTYFGSILCTKSGSSTLPIVIAAYGTGTKPVLTGFSTYTGWTNDGGGIWHKNIPAVTDNLILVDIDNSIQQIGRYPNTDVTNGGYAIYTAINAATPSVTSPSLSGTNWTGAKVVIRKTHWILDICPIVSQTGGTITYTNPAGSSYPGKPNYGCFIQDDIRTLDQFGEWFLNKTTKNLSVYFGANNPSSYTIKVATVDTLLNINNQDYIVVNNIAVEGANSTGIYSRFSPHVIVTNNDINKCFNGIVLKSSTASSLNQYNHISNCLNNAIEQSGSGSGLVTIKNDTLLNNALIAGMGASGDGNYNGIYQPAGSNTIIEYNQVYNTGYLPLTFGGNNVDVAYNDIQNFCTVKDDGGGIYTGNNFSTIIQSNRRVFRNNVRQGIGAPQGTETFATPGKTYDAHGIYLDAQSNHIDVFDNYVSDMLNGTAVFINSGADIQIRRTISYNVRFSMKPERLTATNLNRNILYASNISYPNVNNLTYFNQDLNTPTATTIQNDTKAIFIKIDSNYYRSTTGQFQLSSNLGTPAPLNLAGWKGIMASEANSVNVSTNTPLYIYNASGVATVTPLGVYQYVDVFGTTSTGDYTLAPYTSALLFRNGIVPSANAGGDTTITAPQSSITLFGVGTDLDGTISVNNWSFLTGPNTPTITPSNLQTTTISGLIVGVYSFQFMVTDNSGLTAKDTVQVTVLPALNVPPTANAGGDKAITLPTTSTSVTGTGTNGSGTSRTYAWFFINGPATATFGSSTNATTTINNMTVAGDYNFKLVVTNNLGDSAIANMKVTVSPAIPPANLPPVAVAGAAITITLPTNSTSLDGTASTDPEGGALTYFWSITGPNVPTIANATGSTTGVSGLIQGFYNVTLKVKDVVGDSSTSTTSITVNRSPNQLPVINSISSPLTLQLPNDSTVLTGSATDAEGSVTYAWTQVSGPSLGTLQTPSIATTQIKNLLAGKYVYRLTVTDTDGATATATVEITVLDIVRPNRGVLLRIKP